MIDVGAKTVCFACDECGIHEQVERRMQVAQLCAPKPFMKAKSAARHRYRLWRGTLS